MAETVTELDEESRRLFMDCVFALPRGGGMMVSVQNTKANVEIVNRLIAAGYLYTGADDRTMFSGMPFTLLLTEAGRSLYTLLKV